MKPRFKMVITVDTLAHAQTIRDKIVTQLAGKDIFEQHSLTAFRDGMVQLLVLRSGDSITP